MAGLVRPMVGLEWAAWLSFIVQDNPAPKGSMRAVNQGRHMVEANPRIGVWRWQVTDTARKAKALHERPILTGPVAVRLAFTLHRPSSFTKRSRPWPTHQSPGHGDIDKLARGVLDALQDATVFQNDAQVVILNTVKQYPDSGRSDCLPHPGVLVGVYRWDPGAVE